MPCDDCKFCRPRVYGEKTVLECRESSPIGNVAVWPQVKADDWCGKWEALPATAGREYKVEEAQL